MKAFIFDLDGTLVDTVYAHIFAWQKALTLDPKNKSLADKIQTTKKAIGKNLPEPANPT